MPPPALFSAENETRTISTNSNPDSTEETISPPLLGGTVLQKQNPSSPAAHREGMLGKGNATWSRSTSAAGQGPGGQGPGAADFLIPPRRPIRFSRVSVNVFLEVIGVLCD